MGNSKLMPKTINQHLDSVYPALAMMAGMQLEIFTAINNQRMTAAQVAKILEVKETKLRPLLYALVVAGLLEVDESLFFNTEESAEFLVRGKPRYIGGLHSTYSDLWASTMRTADSIRAGEPKAKHDFSAMTQSELRSFVRGLDAGAAASARRLMKEYDMNQFNRLLDAGGGSGGVAIALARFCPNLSATVAELPNVAPITRECIADNDISDRVGVTECDLIESSPEGAYDAIVMRSVLQVLGADDAQSVVSNCVQTLRRGGEFFVIGRMLDDSRVSPQEAVAVNVMFLNVYEEGQAYTESEYRSWLEAAGLAENERIALAGGYSIMRGVKH